MICLVLLVLDPISAGTALAARDAAPSDSDRGLATTAALQARVVPALLAWTLSWQRRHQPCAVRRADRKERVPD
jgi:hypothetical protein